MANKKLFSSPKHRAPVADTTNLAGGAAYTARPEHDLAQLACTGVLNSVFYASAEDQLATFVGLAQTCSDEFLGKLAIYARQKAYMKDTPAALMAILAGRKTLSATNVLKQAFPSVIDGAKQLRNFVQLVQSGQFGRKSLGTAPKRLVAAAIERMTDHQLFRGTVGNAPRLLDVIRLAHPKASTNSRKALLSYLQDKEHVADDLPPLVREFERWKAGLASGSVEAPPQLPPEMLSGLPLTTEHWTQMALSGGWHFVRMNLNTFARNGVYKDERIVGLIADRLQSPVAIREARVFPYQILAAFTYAEDQPRRIQEALHAAMDLAMANLPEYPSLLQVFVDTSGSMRAPITGHRKGSTSKMTCVQVASLIGCAMLRKSPKATLLGVDTQVRVLNLSPFDSVLMNANRLAAVGGGSTNLSAGLEWMLNAGEKAKGVVFVSDDQSWLDSGSNLWPNRTAPTPTAKLWAEYRKRVPEARMVRIDLQPYRGAQVPKDDPSVLRVGGWSDTAFEVVAEFLAGGSGKDAWLERIQSVELAPALAE